MGRGLPASVLRECVYSAIRMGCYDSVRGAIVGSGAWPYEEGALATKVAAAVASGGLGAAVGSPTELLKVRIPSACRRAAGGVVRRATPRRGRVRRLRSRRAA